MGICCGFQATFQFGRFKVSKSSGKPIPKRLKPKLADWNPDRQPETKYCDSDSESETDSQRWWSRPPKMPTLRYWLHCAAIVSQRYPDTHRHTHRLASPNRREKSSVAEIVFGMPDFRFLDALALTCLRCRTRSSARNAITMPWHWGKSRRYMPAVRWSRIFVRPWKWRMITSLPSGRDVNYVITHDGYGKERRTDGLAGRESRSWVGRLFIRGPNTYTYIWYTLAEESFLEKRIL